MATIGEPGWEGGCAVCAAYASSTTNNVCTCGFPRSWHKGQSEERSPQEVALYRSFYRASYDQMAPEERYGEPGRALWAEYQRRVREAMGMITDVTLDGIAGHLPSDRIGGY